MSSVRRTAASLLAGLALLAIASAASALPIVYYDVTPLGGGLFQYDLFVDNDDGGEPLAGLNVLHGNSVFGLDGSSAITPPPGWSSFAPLPPFVDDVDYFSLTPGSDIAVDGSLGGFSFISDTDPGTLAGDDFAVEGIGADTASQIDLGIAQLVPEPTAAMLLGLGLLGIGSHRARGAVPRKYWHS
jgi:hypothetical protein